MAKKKKDDDEWKAEHQADGSPTVLEGLDIEIKAGSLVAIVGKVGAGKTSILHAILGEMDRM